MKITGANTVPYPAAQVWDALLDPAVLVRTIPGCERLEATGENAYAMTVTAGVAAIKGTYAGSCTLADLDAARVADDAAPGGGRPGHHRRDRAGGLRRGRRCDDDLLRRGRGRGRHGRRRRPADARLGVAPDGRGVLRQRRRDARRRGRGAGRRRAGVPRAEPVARARCSPPPPAPAGVGSQDDFLKGIAVGAGLVLLGVRRGRRSSAGGVDRPHRRLHRRARWRAPWPGARSRRASCWTCTSTGSPRATPSSTRSSRSTRSGPATAPRAADEHLARGGPLGPLHGLPFAVKDTHAAAGWPTTFGSPLFADHVADHDDLIVERIRRGRRGAARQDQRAGVRGRVAHLQPRLRHHPQPARPQPVRRRLERGSGRRAGGGHGAARRRLRHGRLAAQPGVVLRRRRACGPRSAGCRRGPRPTSGRRPRSAARWPATSPTSRCCSR